MGVQPVRPGIEVLLSDSAHLVRGRRVGLLTNQTGVDRAGVSDVELLLGARVELTAIFSPEHGFRGVLDQPSIGHGIDSATGLPIYSLYGELREPTPAMLQLIDVLLIDVQDIGARPYTYISTALLAMRVAAVEGVPVVVLDRPNPIGGELVQGPMSGSAFLSFVGMLPVPLRHGMTLGELALLGNDELRIGADLTVIPAAGWLRNRWYDETGLAWVRPSPNMPSLESAAHYPGLVLFEGTNVSVGRGTPIAFQLVGAPWLDARRVAERIATEPGVSVSDTVVTAHLPADGKYPDIPFPALRFAVTDRSVYDPTRLAARLLWAIREVHRDSFRIRHDAYFDARAGSDALRLSLNVAVSPREIWSSWEPPLAEFRRSREAYLIYR